jgi:cell pole-organizing protein PopZ
MSQAAKAQEPSMEEILASIRRIIADDDAGKPPAKAAPQQGPAAAPRPAAPPPRPPASAPAAPAQPAAAAPPAARQKAGAPEGAAPPGDKSPTRETEGILDLTESMAAPPPGASMPAFQTIDSEPDVVFSDPVVHPEPGPRAIEETRRPQVQGNGTERPLLSGATAAAVDSAFNTLAQTVLVHNARTLEDLVREMLRPMLKAWLDDNLPGLVERIVRAEIERVSRGRG